MNGMEVMVLDKPTSRIVWLENILKYLTISIVVTIIFTSSIKLIKDVIHIDKQLQDIASSTVATEGLIHDRSVYELPPDEILEEFLTEPDVVETPYSLVSQTYDLDFQMITASLLYILAISYSMASMSKVLKINKDIVNQYNTVRETVDDSDIVRLKKNIINNNVLKKISFKIYGVVPIVVIFVCTMSAYTTLQQYSIRIADMVSGTVQAYDLAHSATALEQINQIPGIDVSVEAHLHYQYGPEQSFLSQNGLTISGLNVTSHKMLSCGLIICTKVDVVKYINIIVTYLAMAIIYFSYYWIKNNENRTITIT